MNESDAARQFWWSMGLQQRNLVTINYSQTKSVETHFSSPAAGSPQSCLRIQKQSQQAAGWKTDNVGGDEICRFHNGRILTSSTVGAHVDEGTEETLIISFSFGSHSMRWSSSFLFFHHQQSSRWIIQSHINSSGRGGGGLVRRRPSHPPPPWTANVIWRRLSPCSSSLYAQMQLPNFNWCQTILPTRPTYWDFSLSTWWAT